MSVPEPQPPLWQQLQATANVLLKVRQGQSGTVAVDAVAPRLRPGVQALAFAVLRSQGRALVLRQLLAPRAPPAPVDALLCTALALLWRDDAGYDAFTLVNQTVEAAKKTPTIRPQAGFINACLRRFLRERDALSVRSDRDDLARWNHPAWWVSQLRADWPNKWQAILMAADHQAPMVLRVNVRRTTRADFLSRLQAAGIAAAPVGEQGVFLAAARAVQQIPGFADGHFSVQDAAAQLAAALLLSGWTPAPGTRVLDACAAPGGKTAHLLELADLALTALDVDAVRCQRIHGTLSRLGLQAEVLAADAAEVHAWWNGEPFDAILLDAPCSASGIVRRHPDIRWLRRESDIANLARVQARLLAALWPLLKPGGRLLYCTCSVFRLEGEQQTQAFLANNADASLLPSVGHLLPGQATGASTVVDNSVRDHDGFYFALFRKSDA